MTLEQAMAMGLTSLRKPQWKEARLELNQYKDDSGRKRYGAWATIINPQAEQTFGDAIGQLSLLVEGDYADDWLSCYQTI